MIIATKESKLDKVNKSIFRIISVSSSEDIPKDAWNMDILLPPANLFLDRKNGKIGGKKFAKKYVKFLSKPNTTVENTIFSIGLSMSDKNSICLVCSDEEYEMGYLQTLAEYISQCFGVELSTLKEAKQTIDNAIEILDFSKKEEKLLKKDASELSNGKAAKQEKLLKRINKEIRSTFSYDGQEYLKELDKKYAVDQVVLKLISNKVVSLSTDDEGSFKDVDIQNLGKTSPLIQAIITTAESDKTLKKIIKSVCESHDLKIKEKSLKKLDKPSIVGLLGEIYMKLSVYRSEFHDEDED